MLTATVVTVKSCSRRTSVEGTGSIRTHERPPFVDPRLPYFQPFRPRTAWAGGGFRTTTNFSGAVYAPGEPIESNQKAQNRGADQTLCKKLSLSLLQCVLETNHRRRTEESSRDKCAQTAVFGQHVAHGLTPSGPPSVRERPWGGAPRAWSVWPPSSAAPKRDEDSIISELEPQFSGWFGTFRLSVSQKARQEAPAAAPDVNRRRGRVLGRGRETYRPPWQ